MDIGRKASLKRLPLKKYEINVPQQVLKTMICVLEETKEIFMGKKSVKETILKTIKLTKTKSRKTSGLISGETHCGDVSGDVSGDV